MKVVYNLESFVWTKFKGDQITRRVILTLCPLFPAGNALIELPYIAYYKTKAIQETDSDLISEIEKFAIDKNIQFIEFRSHELPKLEHLSYVNKTFHHFILNLEGGLDNIWKKSFDTKLRNQIRKSEKSNLEFKVGKNELLNDFYNLYERTMKRLGSPAHPRRFFQKISSDPNGKFYFLIVYFEKRPVAGLYLCHDLSTMFNPWACSDENYKKFCVNNFAYFQAIQLAINLNLSFFDFGRSAVGTPHEKFKLQWGVEKKLINYSFLGVSKTKNFEIKIDSPLIVLLRNIWIKFPFFATRLLNSFFSKRVA